MGSFERWWRCKGFNCTIRGNISVSLQCLMKDFSKDLRFKVRYLSEYLKECNFLGSDKIYRAVKRAVKLPSVSEKCIIKSRHGYSIVVDPSEHIGGIIFRRGSYEEGLLQILWRLISYGDTVVDVGANTGQISLHAAYKLDGSGKVISFEPEEKNYNMLCKAVDINDFRNINTVKEALGSEEGEMELYMEEEENRGSYALRNISSGSSSKVKVGTLNNYVRENNIESVDLIKIDVEGFEMEVLKGADKVITRRTAPVCIIEYNNCDDIINYMLELNDYQVYYMCPSKFEPSKLVKYDKKTNIPQFENLFFLMPSHIDKMDKNMFM